MSPLPNPDTYLNHLTPTEGAQFEAARNLCLAVLGATIWDILIYVPDDIKVLRKGPFRLATFCFLSSRLFALTFVLLSVIQQTGPLNNCEGMAISTGIMCFVAMASTSFLFLQRVRALYAENRWIQTIFTSLWIACIGVMTTVAFGIRMTHIPGTRYCTYSIVHRYVAAGAFVRFFFDALVYFAVAYHIASSKSNLDAGITKETLLSGRAFSRISRALFRGGQQYYLMALCLNFPVGVLIALPSTSPIYKLILGTPSVALAASMASRVYRILKAPETRNGRTTVVSDVNFATHPHPQKSTIIATGAEDMRSFDLRSNAQLSSTLPSHTQETTYASNTERRTITIVFPHKTDASESSDSGAAAKDTSFTAVDSVEDGHERR